MARKFSATGLIVLVTLSLFLCGCAKFHAPTADDTQATQKGVEAVINANNQFAFDLYSEYKSEDGNIFFSPYSISTALAMTYEGAKGKTAEEMQSVFHFPEDADIRRPAFAKIYNEINKKDKRYKIHTANALWAGQSYLFLEEYINLIDNYYAGKTTNLDFKTETEESRQIINEWVEEQTNNKIKDLIQKGNLNDMTRLVLTNAIYFKGDWLQQFDKKKTKEQDFIVSPDKTVKVQMMSLTGGKVKFNYGETETLQILEMDYKAEELSMLVILPQENDLALIEESINAAKLSDWKGLMRERKINIYIPKFKFETKYFIGNTLADMGMPTAFSSDADFSGMDGTKLLYIDKVIHQAFVEVNEEGTEAAAATAVVKGILSAMPPVFRADHPFIFLIQQKETGNILFMGRVVDPTS